MRLKQLDMLRAAAVLLVLCAHVESVGWLRRCGWTGVDLFFVLSGFLVSGLLFSEHKKHGRLEPKRFLVRRGLKIYPAFYAFVLGSLALAAARRTSVPADRLLAELLFVQNYYGGLWGHTWSLCVEEHFYLLLTACLFLLSKRAGEGRRAFSSIPKIYLCVAAFALAARSLTYYLVTPYDFNVHFKPTHLRLDALLFGVLLSYLHHYHREPFARFVRARATIIMLFSVAVLIPPTILEPDAAYISTVGFTFIYMGFGGVLVLFLYREAALPAALARVLRPAGDLLAWVGTYSYSIYLWHLIVASLGLSVFRRAWGAVTPAQPWHSAEFGFYVVASVVVGVVMAKLVEMPILRLRDRFFPTRSGSAVGSTAGGHEDARGGVSGAGLPVAGEHPG